MMNKTLLIILSLIVSFANARAQTYLKAKEKLPSDAAMALEFLQLNSPDSKTWQKEIKDLDQLLSQLSEEERLMILKSELYKAILKTSRGVPVQRVNYKRQTLQRLQDSFQKAGQEKWDPFSTFFIRALITDLTAIMSDVDYPNFLNSLLSNSELSPQARSFKQRLDTLLPWVQWYFEGSLPGLEQKLLKASEMALSLFKNRAQNLIFMTEFDKQDQNNETRPLQFFEVRPIPDSTPKDQNDSKSALEKVGESGPLGQQDDLDEKWVPRIAPDPNYEPPETLPRPVDDWLPKPVNDWLNDM